MKDEIWLQDYSPRRIETFDQSWDCGDRRISHQEEAHGSCLFGLGDYGFPDGPSYKYTTFRSPNEPGIHGHTTCEFQGTCGFQERRKYTTRP